MNRNSIILPAKHVTHAKLFIVGELGEFAWGRAWCVCFHKIHNSQNTQNASCTLFDDAGGILSVLVVVGGPGIGAGRGGGVRSNELRHNAVGGRSDSLRESHAAGDSESSGSGGEDGHDQLKDKADELLLFVGHGFRV